MKLVWKQIFIFSGLLLLLECKLLRVSTKCRGSFSGLYSLVNSKLWILTPQPERTRKALLSFLVLWLKNSQFHRRKVKPNIRNISLFFPSFEDLEPSPPALIICQCFQTEDILLFCYVHVVSGFSLDVLIALSRRIGLTKAKLPWAKANVLFVLKFPNDFHTSSIMLGTQWPFQCGNSLHSIWIFFFNNSL